MTLEEIRKPFNAIILSFCIGSLATLLVNGLTDVLLKNNDDVLTTVFVSLIVLLVYCPFLIFTIFLLCKKGSQSIDDVRGKQ